MTDDEVIATISIGCLRVVIMALGCILVGSQLGIVVGIGLFVIGVALIK